MASIEVLLTQVGPSTTSGVARGHEILVDRPESKGGADRGAMGGEYMLMGIGGCFASNLLAAARARDIALSDLRLRVTAEIADAPSRFSAIHVIVGSALGRGELEKLVVIADRACISMNTIRSAVALTVDVEPG